MKNDFNEEATQSNYGSNEKKFKITRAIDLINRVKSEPEPKIIWNGIVEGSKGIITGVAKTGKTTLAENLAISIAVGRKDFFGYQLSGKPQKVLFVNLEESFRLRSRRNLKQIEILSDKERDFFAENYISTPEGFPQFLNSVTDWEILRDYIIESEADIVFIDSLTHMFKGQIESSDQGTNFMKNLNDYISILKKTIIVIHHNVKTNDKPIDQASIAGSRTISQDFEYAIGLGNIPTNTGGNYMCMIYNKYVEKNDTEATLYKINSSNWVENLGVANKFDLYAETKTDYRIRTDNKDLVYNYIKSKYSLGSQPTLTGDLKKTFVENSTKTMAKDTLYKCLDKLIQENKIEKQEHGSYIIKSTKTNTDEK